MNLKPNRETTGKGECVDIYKSLFNQLRKFNIHNKVGYIYTVSIYTEVKLNISY